MVGGSRAAVSNVSVARSVGGGRLLLVEPGDDGGVVAGGVGECLPGQPLAGVEDSVPEALSSSRTAPYSAGSTTMPT